jgi:hypothetical protein
MPMSVSDVIDRLRAQGNVGKAGFLHAYENPKRLPSKLLAALRLPKGEPLPADLAEWLRYDASWFKLLKKDQKAFRSRPLRKLLESWLKQMRESDDEDVEEELEELIELVGDDPLAYWLKSLPEPTLADVHAIVVPTAGDQEHLLMLEPGRKSLRVLGCHKRIEFWWKYDSFAAYLAHHFGFEDPE